jgi:hypothetical protein
MLLASVKYKNILYRLVAVKQVNKTVYFVNAFTQKGTLHSVRFSNLCSAYGYFKQFKHKKSKSINHLNQVALW